MPCGPTAWRLPAAYHPIVSLSYHKNSPSVRESTAGETGGAGTLWEANAGRTFVLLRFDTGLVRPDNLQVQGLEVVTQQIDNANIEADGVAPYLSWRARDVTSGAGASGGWTATKVSRGRITPEQWVGTPQQTMRTDATSPSMP